METIIQLEKVDVTYNKGKVNEMTALHGIDLKIYDGEYIVFLGPSGSGKSTLLYTIAGLESPSAGTVVVGGKDLTKIGKRDRIQFYRSTIGMVFQAFYLVPHLSTRDNVILAKMFSGARPEEREPRAKELMDRFGITDFAGRKPSMLSGGQQQRTAIARALMNDPRIILADEPVGNLDSKNAAIVLELLADIHEKEKKTIIQVTHNANDARYADRVFYIKDGAIEKIVANTERGRIAQGASPKRSEFEKLAEANPTFTNYEVLASFMMRQALGLYDLETEQKVVKSIERYAHKEIDRAGLVHALSDSKEGAGLYVQRAIHIASEVERMMKEIETIGGFAGKEAGQEGIGENSLAGSVVSYLLETYKGSLSPVQHKLLASAIGDRFGGKLNAEQLREFLDRPLKEGGIGLNSRTAKRFADEIEAVLLKNMP